MCRSAAHRRCQMLSHNAVKGRRKTTPLQTDPSRTVVLRNEYMRDMAKRFAAFRKEVWKLIVEEDAFGLDPKNRTLTFPATNTRWKFRSDQEKVSEFKKWITKQTETGLLETKGKKPWTSKYVDSAYRKGRLRGYTDVHKESLSKSLDFYKGSKEQFLRDAFGQPETMAKVQALYTRSFEDLEGVSATMSKNMGRILAQGIAQGKGAEAIARDLDKSIGSLSKSRAMTIARTEVIHAHAEGQLDSFEDLGIEEVGVLAEWSTAGDGAVCPLCSDLSGVVMTIKEARGLIPRHPNCRCTWIPAFDNRKEKGQKRTKGQISKAIDKSVAKEKPNAKNPRRSSSWRGADRYVPPNKLPPERISKAEEDLALPALFGKSPTSVLRWMGQEGFSVTEARTALANMGVEASENTIKTQLSWGRTGKKAVAELSEVDKMMLRARKDKLLDVATTSTTPEIIVKPSTTTVLPPPAPVVEPTVTKIAVKQVTTVDEAAAELKKYTSTGRPITPDLSKSKTIETSNEAIKQLDGMKQFKKVGEFMDDPYSKGGFSLDFAKGSSFTSSNARQALGTYQKDSRYLRVASGLPKKEKAPTLGKFSVGKDFGTVLRHEYGHHYWYQSLASSDRIEWTTATKEFVGSKVGEKAVSVYGASCPTELYAESFAAYTNPLYERGSLPSAIEKLMDKHLKGE